MGIEFSDLTRKMQKSLVKTAPKPRLFMQFFKNKATQDSEIVELDKQFKGVRVAQFVNPDAVADGTEKLSFEGHTFKLPTVQDLMTLTSKELRNRLRGENVYTQTSFAAKAAILVAEVQQEQRDMVENSMEVMAIDACFNGKITVVGKGENRVVDFARSLSHTIDLGSGNYWDEDDGDPASDIEEFISLIGADGSNATHIIGRVETISKLIKKLEANKSEFDSRRIERGSLVFESFADVSGAIYYGKYKGLEIWGYDGNYTDKDGVSQKAVPSKQVAILSAMNGNVDIAGYAGDIDIDFQISRDTKAVKDARNFVSKISKAKKVVEVEAIQTRAPMLVDADSTLVATVLS